MRECRESVWIVNVLCNCDDDELCMIYGLLHESKQKRNNIK